MSDGGYKTFDFPTALLLMSKGHYCRPYKVEPPTQQWMIVSGTVCSRLSKFEPLITSTISLDTAMSTKWELWTTTDANP